MSSVSCYVVPCLFQFKADASVPVLTAMMSVCAVSGLLGLGLSLGAILQGCSSARACLLKVPPPFENDFEPLPPKLSKETWLRPAATGAPRTNGARVRQRRAAGEHYPTRRCCAHPALCTCCACIPVCPARLRLRVRPSPSPSASLSVSCRRRPICSPTGRHGIQPATAPAPAVSAPAAPTSAALTSAAVSLAPARKLSRDGRRKAVT